MSGRTFYEPNGIDTSVSRALPAHPGPLPSSPPDPQFDEFWSAYPRKVGKGSARRRWNVELRKGTEPRQIIAAVERFRDECQAAGTPQKYIPHPATWLSDERYGDALPAASESTLTVPTPTPAPSPRRPPRPPALSARLNDEQLLAAVVRLTADQTQPITAATAIICAVRQQVPSTVPEDFPVVAAERGRVLAAMPYPEYLESPEWQARRKVMLRRAVYRCQVCNRDRLLHVHHRTYEHRGIELPSDLVVLCDECHELFHQNGRLADAPPAA